MDFFFQFLCMCICIIIANKNNRNIVIAGILGFIFIIFAVIFYWALGKKQTYTYNYVFTQTNTHTDTYDDLLNDIRWKDKRTKILKRDYYKCRHCGSTHKLQVHHKYYNKYPNEKLAMPWDYPDNALITLCDDCHRLEHERKPIKTYYRKQYEHFE